jgi:hypothetical protein
MNSFQTTVSVLGITIAFSLPAKAQGEAAVPFLLISPSVEANGMGGTTIALRRFDPTSAVFSPAQIGFSALTTNVGFGVYPATSRALTGFALDELEYGAWAANAGILLNDFIDLPLRIGVGLAFHRVELDLGTFLVTGPSGPEAIGKFDAYENASGFVFGLGIEYILRFGFGYTFRSVESHLSPFGTESEQAAASVSESANDYGFLLEAPLVSVVEEITGGSAMGGGSLHPFLGLSAGVAWNSVGDRLIYVDPAQADPFPRTARAGIGVQGGLRLERAPEWELLSAAWSREAEDLLVIRKEDGTWEYQSGLGDIQFGTNVVQGVKTGNVGLRSGWQVQAAEIFTYRHGTVRQTYSYDTWGYTIQLAGILKGISNFAGSETPGWLLFMRDHIDAQYHFAESTLQQPQQGDFSSSGFTVTFHTLPW